MVANDNGNGYPVIHQGKQVAGFHFFVDAWLYAKLECTFWTKIVSKDGTWVINPFSEALKEQVPTNENVPEFERIADPDQWSGSTSEQAVS
jgi:hypothetical protein